MIETIFALFLGCFVGFIALMIFVMAILFFEKDD
jgi:hypothetical protein